MKQVKCINYFIISFLALFVLESCSIFSPVLDPGVGGIFQDTTQVLSLSEENIEDDIMAYVLTDDAILYVAPAHEKEVQQALGAEIKDNVWTYKNDLGVVQHRPRKDLDADQYWNQVATIKWTKIKGYRCEEKPKGFFLPVHDVRSDRNKAKLVYETQAKGNWCIYRKYDYCNLVWKDTKGTYIKLRNGKVLKRNGKVVRIQTTVKLMSCVRN